MARNPLHKSHPLSFRLDEETERLLEEQVRSAQGKGVTSATAGTVARALLRAALGMPPRVAAAQEAMLQAFGLQKQVGVRLSALVADNLPALLGPRIAENLDADEIGVANSIKRVSGLGRMSQRR